MKKYSNLFKLLILILFMSSTLTNKYYYESPESLQKRIKWNEYHTRLFTNGRLSIDYSNDTGFYCKAEDDIAKEELVITVPSDYLICGFDLFPFK